MNGNQLINMVIRMVTRMAMQKTREKAQQSPKGSAEAARANTQSKAIQNGSKMTRFALRMSRMFGR